MNEPSPQDLIIALFYQNNNRVRIESFDKQELDNRDDSSARNQSTKTLASSTLIEMFRALENQEDIPMPLLESLAILINFVQDLDTLSEN